MRPKVKRASYGLTSTGARPCSWARYGKTRHLRMLLRHAILEHEFENADGRFCRGASARALPSWSPTPASRHPSRLFAMLPCDWTPGVHGHRAYTCRFLVNGSECGRVTYFPPCRITCRAVVASVQRLGTFDYIRFQRPVYAPAIKLRYSCGHHA
jgi:hypothetical protein